MEVDTVVEDDLLMECDEEEVVVFSTTSEGNEETEEKMDEDMWSSVGLKNDTEESNPPPDRVIPIPTLPVTSLTPPTLSGNVKFAGSTLGFKVNGQPILLQPGGGGAELKLCSNPGGSASGFTTIHIPVSLTVHGAAGNHYVTTTASLTASVTSSTAPAPPSGSEPIPIITGVVSGEAAQKVLNDHNVDFRSSSQASLKSPQLAGASTVKPKKPRTKPCPSEKLTAPEKLLKKGEVGPVTPPNCVVCLSQYKLISELRGFMCMCCPVIALSLINLKKQRIKQQRKKREKLKISKLNRDSQTISKVSKIQPGLPVVKVVSPPQRTRRLSDEFLSDGFSSSASTNVSPIKQEQFLPAPELPQSKLVMLVEDFYYGHSLGGITDNLQDEKFIGSFRCIHCPKTLRNNIKLMDHMQQHVSTMSPEDEETDATSCCPHCFRHFPSPFRLQCHLEVVHSQSASTVTCKICELAFDSEPAFLCHMKNTHKPGEMPYACQVCDFRSSFYSDVWSHFRESHSNTRNLLCQYCLRVLRSNSCYQQHFARHQKKHVLSCNKCRLHFLYVKERVDHKGLHHKTHIIPPQLSGLKPGTKVTVRTYSVLGGSESEAGQKAYVPCKLVQVDSPLSKQEDPKKKPVESLGALLSGLTAYRDFNPSQLCVECLKSVPDLKAHFPALVRCSICKFSTCCCNTYANHMINNHTIGDISKFPTIFRADPRLSQTLRCVSCTFSTNRGDVMANHLTERPDHVCSLLTENGCVGVDQFSTSVFSKEIWRQVKKFSSDSENFSQNGHGAFVPIQLVPPGQTSNQVSIKPLKCIAAPSFTPAMTIKILGTGEPKVTPLKLAQLTVVLSSLCHGIFETARRYRTPPVTIRSWITQLQSGLPHRKWCWRTDKMAEWVLDRREQQLTVEENVLLMTARAALGDRTQVEERYSWTIDFMLRHDLGLQTTNKNRVKSIRENRSKFIQSLYTQIQRGVLPLHCWGCMDELPVFIKSDLFAKQNSEAFQVFCLPMEKPTFDIVISALSDGTFLPPLLFFTGTATEVPDGFPDNVLLEAREEGFTDEDRLQIWIDKVWSSCVTLKHKRESLLVVDVHRGHLSDRFKESLATKQTDLAFIPPGCSSVLQPLEICVTQVLRDFLQARWTQLVLDGGLDGLRLDQLALTLACWLSEVSSTLSMQMDILRRSFSLAYVLQHSDGQEEAMRMITALSEALIQCPETEVPERRFKHEYLNMKEDKQHEHSEEEKSKGPKEENQGFVSSLTALQHVFDAESDEESFHGFSDE